MKHNGTPDRDRGSALIIAMMVMGVTMSLSLIVVSVAMGTSRTTGGDRQRLSAINAAEAAVDASYASIEGGGALLPCSWPLYGTEDVRTSPDTTVSSATIVYTGASGATGCPSDGTLAPGDTPVQAVITGTGTATNGAPRTRKMEALVNLAPVRGDGLDKALFGNRAISIENNATVSGTAGASADLYTNGDFYCDSSPTFRGSVIAPSGKITMMNSCAATGDAWARDAVLLEGGKTIGGRVLSAGSTISAAGNTGVNGTLMAAGAISWTHCTLPAKCLSHQSAVPVPPTSTFPQINGGAAALSAWTAAPPAGPGYTVVPVPADKCGRDAGDWLKTKMAALAVGTIFTSDCHVRFRGTQDTPIGADVMLFAKGGVSTNNQVSLRSTGGPRNVYFIQPYDAVVPYTALPCERYPTSSPVMGPSQQFSSTSDIALMWYSPCDISYGNQGGSFGQVFSGSRLITNNQFTLTLRRLPIFGSTGSTAVQTLSYDLGVVHKRETR